MNTSSCEVEAFVKASGIHAVILLLSNVIGPMKTDDLSVSELQVYEYEGVKVRLQQSEDGFISVWVSGSELWPSSPTFGRYLAAELSCVVRCDQEQEFPEVSPQSSVFLQIEGNRESLITWV
jgi:hypothetical protein